MESESVLVRVWLRTPSGGWRYRDWLRPAPARAVTVGLLSHIAPHPEFWDPMSLRPAQPALDLTLPAAAGLGGDRADKS